MRFHLMSSLRSRDSHNSNMKLMTYFVGFCIFIIFPPAEGVFTKGESNHVMKFKNSKICPKHNDTEIMIKDLKVVRLTKDQYIFTAKTFIKEDVPGPLYSRIKVERCQDNKGSDTCVHYFEKEFSDLCKELENPKSKAYDLMNNTLNIPNPRCPLPKGEYPLRSKPFDAGDSGDKVAVLGKIWKLEMYFLKDGEKGNKVPVCCVTMDALTEPKPKKEKNRNWGAVPKSSTEGPA